jgi:hypothetical protein
MTMTMQTQADKQFDKFIQSEMNNFILETSFDEQWTKMSCVLDRKFKVAPLDFNIYSLSFIIIGILIAILLYFNSEEINKPNENEGQGKNIPEVKENIFIQNEDNTAESKKAKSQFQNKKVNPNKKMPSPLKNILSTEIVSEGLFSKEDKDTMTQSTVNENTGKNIKMDSVIRPIIIKKIKYITKRDTIIQIDTNKIIKKR